MFIVCIRCDIFYYFGCFFLFFKELNIDLDLDIFLFSYFKDMLDGEKI